MGGFDLQGCCLSSAVCWFGFYCKVVLNVLLTVPVVKVLLYIINLFVAQTELRSGMKHNLGYLLLLFIAVTNLFSFHLGFKFIFFCLRKHYL